jgi:hypothetical protein
MILAAPYLSKHRRGFQQSSGLPQGWFAAAHERIGGQFQANA